MNNSRKWIPTSRILFFLVILISFLLAGSRSFLAQEDEDITRRLWNKQFQSARARQRTKQMGKSGTTGSKTKIVTDHRRKEGANVDAPVGGLDDELFGITFWKLREEEVGDDEGLGRLMVQKNSPGIKSRPNSSQIKLIATRVSSESVFAEGDLVRLSIEVPRNSNNYLYIVDREVYADGTLGKPYLIFPTKNTRHGDNVLGWGKLIDIPARDDRIPYFYIERSRADQVSERLTIVVSPFKLDVSLSENAQELSTEVVDQWERQWGGKTEKRETSGGLGSRWTSVEQAAAEKNRRLIQNDPLPQTMYRVQGNPKFPMMIVIPLKIRS